MVCVTIVSLFAALVITTFVHISGFVLMARLFGITARVFSIFMGPVLFSFKLRKTQYQLSLLPLGGYAKFPNTEEPFNTPSGEERLDEAHPFKRCAVYLGGCTFLAVFSIAILGPQEWWHSFQSTFQQYLRGALSPLKYGAPGLRAFFDSQPTFPTLVAVMAAKLCAMHLLPLPNFNGGDAILTLIRWRRMGISEWDNRLTIIGLLIMLPLIIGWWIAVFDAIFLKGSA